MFNPLWLSISTALCVAQTDHFYSNQIAVKVLGGPESARELAKRHACEYVGQIGNLQDYYLLEHQRIAKRSLMNSRDAHQTLTNDPEVEWLEQQVIKPRTKRDFMGDDFGNLLFPASGPTTPSSGNVNNIDPTTPRTAQQYMFQDPLYSEQWYLHQGARSNFDMNVKRAWRRNYTGRGISVSILDDGLQTNHPDLMQNYDPKASLDIIGRDDDPTPTDHANRKDGTRCAGVVAAVADNYYCGVGIAYNAEIGGVRMWDGAMPDSAEAAALSHNPQHIHIYTVGWGPDDDGRTVDGPGPLTRKALQDGINHGRKGLGSIFVWASGIGGRNQDSCSCDGYTNSIYTLSISSAAQDGSRPWYVEECPSILATTYSSGAYNQPAVITTDLNTPGNGMRPCTNQYTGTSASACLAAGIMALVLEANPNLNWRDLQYLTILSARPGPLVEEDWVTNGVGRKVSTKFGFGLMDADTMVQLAEKWSTVPEQHTCYTQKITQFAEVKNGYLAVEISTDGCQADANSVVFVEHVQAVLSIEAKQRGTLVVKVTSPMNTTSVMLHERRLDKSKDGFTEWPFMSVQSWGENPVGTWKIEVIDTSTSGRLIFNSKLVSWSLVLHGTAKDPIPRAMKEALDADDSNTIPVSSTVTASPEPPLAQQPYINCHVTCQTCHGTHMDECDSCYKDDYIHNDRCLSACPPGFHPLNDTCKYCNAECVTCSGPTAKECLSCRPPRLLFGSCLDQCPDGNTPENGTCVAKDAKRLNETGDYGSVFNSSSAYFVTAAIVCAVIICIGLVVFCCLRARRSVGRTSQESRKNVQRVGEHGPKYAKASLHPVDADDKEVDEKVEMLSKRRL